MMREIKFRAWNTIVRRFQYFTLPDLEKQDGPIQWHILKIDQYTGLKDRNGVEIYEGDVVYFDYNYIGRITVKWDDEKGGFNIGAYVINKCDVVGNIHEKEKTATNG